MAPNCRLIVEALAHEYPQEFRDCHKFGLAGDRPWAFIRRLAWVLHTTVDVRFGLNGKRGNVNDPSADAVSFRNPASAAGGVEIYDVVAAAGSEGATPTWQDVTQATLAAGTVGAYIAPQPVQGTIPTPPSPTPVPPTTPCQWRPCTVQDDVAGLYESLGNLVVQVELLAARQEALSAAVVAHLDDVKGRIERVSQEVANKPVTTCRLPRWTR